MALFMMSDIFIEIDRMRLGALRRFTVTSRKAAFAALK